MATRHELRLAAAEAFAQLDAACEDRALARASVALAAAEYVKALDTDGDLELKLYTLRHLLGELAEAEQVVEERHAVWAAARAVEEEAKAGAS